MKTLRVLGIAAVTLLATSCSASTPIPGLDEESSTGGPLYTVVTADVRGGMCPEGECKHSFKVLSDGRWTLEFMGEDDARGAMSSDDLNNLKDAIVSADASQIPPRPDDYTCPIAYDGTMTEFVFYGGDDPITVDTCSHDLTEFEPALLVEKEWRTIER